jgi:predicted metal-binding protein
MEDNLAKCLEGKHLKCPTRVDTFSVKVYVYHEMTTLILTEQKVNTTGDNNPRALRLHAEKSCLAVAEKEQRLSIWWFMMKSGRNFPEMHGRISVT